MRMILVVLPLALGGCGGKVGGEDASDDTPADGIEDTAVDAALDTAGDGTDVPPDGTTEYNCANPHPDWQLCEDFEEGSGDFDAWLADSDFQGGVQRLFLAVPWIWIGASGVKLYFTTKN